MNFLIFCLCICVFWIRSQCSNVTQPDVVTSQIQFLINEEKGLRQKLQTRVSKLRNEAAALNTTIVPCSCPPANPIHKSTKQVSFTATMHAAMTSLTTSALFPFTYDISNVGMAYNMTSSEFTAPVDGIYGFSLTIFMNPGRYWVGMQLVRNGHSILKVRTGHYAYSSTNRQVNMGTNFVLLNMTAGDTVWPQYLGDSDSHRIWGDGVTTFSGFLLHEL